MVLEACSFPFTLSEDVMIEYQRWLFVEGALCGWGASRATLAAGFCQIELVQFGISALILRPEWWVGGPGA